MALGEYYFPSEDKKHEGTWLIWPHEYTYGKKYRDEIEPIWIEMTSALHEGENIHIIVYNKTEKREISKLLTDEQIDMEKIDFVIAKSDDVWVRDTGPIFVLDKNNTLTIVDFAFNGWGNKVKYKNDDAIPKVVADEKNIPIIDLSDFVLEGGSIELDGEGTFMATKSSIISENRNPKLTKEKAEKYIKKYFNATNFIWLDGVIGEDITDAHIDGIARFFDSKTLLTVSEDDFFELYENIKRSDYEILKSAKNASGEQYEIIEIPTTSKNVKGLDYKGSYLNFYIANEVLLLPIYNDSNDQKAIDIMSKLYKDKEIIPIDVTSLFQYGGMLHCITQQQPL